ncbi:NusG domain II-containing protein [Candidatus Xianfuyuplasma coldseepsis]|uniref:NusG domain II-containing protein n=1 Tax=Candidatus Xianfuyuplasma coldseepsis TaxID=2782163 RepID=A0A7L7KNW0_9MOLU|nr:NusG domain II-containing protein [Xianfuyuplasma coldseepsis]QMS84460.1 NusG domain II-containing protein [Xianfuyuplasma coldseepsis]
MHKSDWILIAVILIVAVSSFLIFRQVTNDNALVDGVAIVYYNNEKIVEIELEDGNYKIFNEDRVINIDEENDIFHVLGSNPYGVYIEYSEQRVRVIDEESPKHICQTQGWTNSPLSPLTCLPNNIIIVVEAKDPNLPDDITG